MIKVEHLTKIYTSGKVKVRALADISFELPSSGCVFVLGKSGCGKTTLLNMLGGMDSPTSGDIIVNGRSIITNKASDLDAYRNNCVGFVFQEFNLLNNYSAGSNVLLAEQLQGQKVSREVVDDILRRVELTDRNGNTLYDRNVTELSGGQKQRVAIARALIKDPDIILADEPTGALDSETGEALFNLLKDLSKSKLIVVISHDRESAEKYADRIIELKDGFVTADRVPAGRQASGTESEPEDSTDDQNIVNSATDICDLSDLPTDTEDVITDAYDAVTGDVITDAYDAATGKSDSVTDTGDSSCNISNSAQDTGGSAETGNASPFRKRKGGLPFTRVFTFGVSGFRKKIVRLILSVILAVFAFTLFVFITSLMNVDVMVSELKTAYENGAATVTASAYATMTQTTKQVSNGYTKKNSESSAYVFSEKQIDTLSSSTGIYPVVAAETSGNLYLGQDTLSSLEIMNPYLRFSQTLISRYIAVNADTGVEGACLEPATPDSRLPVASDEIAITDYQADIFVRFGYKDVEKDGYNAEAESIATPGDMIGRSINGRTVVGIYSTEEALSSLQEQYDKDYNGTPGTNEYYRYFSKHYSYYLGWEEGYHMSKTAIISDEGIDMSNLTTVVYSLTGKVSGDRKLFNSISDKQTYDESDSDNITYTTVNYTVSLSSAYSGFTKNAEMFTDEVWLIILLAVSIVAAAFTALLLTTLFLAVSDDRKREIGILRAMGSSKADVIKICLTESMVIGLADYIISLLVGGLICLIINKSMHFYMISIGILPAIYLFILCFGVVALATILPALRVARQNPADIMASL